MNHLWSWLNINSLAVQSLVTVGSLVAVLTMGIWTNRNAQRTIREMQAQRSLSVRPRLELETTIFDIDETTVIVSVMMTTEFDRRTVRYGLRFRNVGAGSAYDVGVDQETRHEARIKCFASPQTVAAGDTFSLQVVVTHPIHTLPDFELQLRYRDLDDAFHHTLLHVDGRQSPPRIIQTHHRGPSRWERTRSFIRSRRGVIVQSTESPKGESPDESI